MAGVRERLIRLHPAWSLVVCIWLAAAALARSENRGQAASGATLGTFLLLVYWVIGVWFIRPRLARLDAPATAA